MPRRRKGFDWRKWRAREFPGGSFDDYLQWADRRKLPTIVTQVWTLNIWPDRIEVRPARHHRGGSSSPTPLGAKANKFKTQLGAIRFAKVMAKKEHLLLMVQDLDGSWRPIK